MKYCISNEDEMVPFEEFEQIENYDNYLISSNGRVYSYISGKYLKQCINGEGYKFVNLCKNGIEKKL